MSIDFKAVNEMYQVPKDNIGCCGFHAECTPLLECVRTGKHAGKMQSKCSLFNTKWGTNKKKGVEIDAVELHVHSTFSIKDAYGYPEQLVLRAKELGMSAIAITDHGNTSAHPQLEKACRKHGIKPIYGCEFYIVANKAQNKQKKNHITCLAKNLTGYKNILKLASLGHQPGNFYYMPTIDLRDLVQHREGVIVLDGCGYGLTSQLLVEDNLEEASRVTLWFKEKFGSDFYMEVQPLQLDFVQKIAELKGDLARRYQIPLVATNDVHFIEPGQEFIQNFLRMVRVNGDVNNNQGNMDSRCRMADGATMVEWFQSNNATFDYMSAVKNTKVIADKVEEFELPKAKNVKYPTNDPKELLLQECRKGWQKRGLGKLRGEDKNKYLERLLYELETVNTKGFDDYFLVVWDAVDWAKSTRPLPYQISAGVASKKPILVGPARGSAAGSLVSYLIGITEVDPIKFDLLFERFIDISRPDPPDIDIDFQNDRRDEVKEYLKQKYGEAYVTNLAGYGTWGGKSLLDDIGRCFNIIKSTIEEAKNELHENGGTKTVKQILQERWPELVELHKVEGMIRNLTKHAAGVVVTCEDLTNFGTIGRDGILLDKRDAEYMNLLKIDALGLTTLTIIQNILDKIGKDSKWLYSLPLDDRLTLSGFNEGKFMGVFQFEGYATKGVCKQLNVQDFQITIDITALSRPGPLQSGATQSYIQGKAAAIHPIVTEHTQRSRNQVLYQEQMMRILKSAGLGWADVTTVRKLITKKEGYEKLEGIKQRFLQYFEGDPNPDIGEEVWHATVGGGGYGFNISHACSYSHITYYTMYLKKHYPLEFYWGNMVIEPANKSMLKEFQQGGGKILGVKFGRSKGSWSIDNGGLRAGYLTIKGVGPAAVAKLMTGDMPTGSAYKLLMNAGAFDEEEDTDYLGLEELKKRLAVVGGRDNIANIQPGDFVRIAGVITKLDVKNLREYYEKNGKDYSEVEDPEKCLYVNMKIMDESGEIMVSINRYKCADPLTMDMLTNRRENQLFVVVGQRAKDYEKVYCSRISPAADENDDLFGGE